MTSAAPRGISTKNRELLGMLNRGFDGPFSVRDAAIALDYTIDGARRFLAYLAARGWLVRVRRGYYTTVPLDAIEPTEWREDPWLVASKVSALPVISAAGPPVNTGISLTRSSTRQYCSPEGR